MRISETTSSYRSAVFWTLLLAALVWGGARAWSLRWTTDDAFISFRYAQNLAEGRGLVYNEGERVEGYSNPLWTLWIALGLWLGLGAAGWADMWSLLCYLGSIGLLGWNCRLLGRVRGSPGWVFPLAALGAALHPDWNVFATGGLETSAFTFLLLAGCTTAVWNLGRPVALGGAGLMMALAALTRPDGLLPAAIVGVCVLAWSREHWKATTCYVLAFCAVWVPFTIWRVVYYGDFFPNTYYAKSAYLAWYSQGWRYLSLYLEKYWLLALGPVLLVLTWLFKRRSTAGSRLTHPQLALASGAVALVYVWYVVRVGGDFMFARMLIPATPFLLILLELGIGRLFGSRRWSGAIVSVALLVGMFFTPAPIAGTAFRHGVADERGHYLGEVQEMDRVAAVLASYFEGLPVRFAVFGGEARVAYKSGVHVAVECGGALTEPVVARREIVERGERPGHEKYPSAGYLVEQRKAHFTIAKAAEEQLQLDRFIPRVIVRFGDDVYARVLHWDPPLMEELRRRGAEIPDFETSLDGMLPAFSGLSSGRRIASFEQLERFYFRHVEDSVRETAFREMLPDGPPPPNLIVVMVDTLRADHLGYHGYERATSPRIDALARESIVFMNHNAHASRTGPSVASFFTGLHPRSHGVVNPLSHWDAKGTLAEEQVTLAEILSDHGYGGLGLVANINVGPRFGFAQGFDAYHYVRSESAVDVNRGALESVRRLGEPFFLYLHYMEPHSPYDAPAPYDAMFVDKAYDGPITGAHEQLDEIVAGDREASPADVERLKALYDQEIRLFDDRFGELLDSLEEMELADNTIVVLLADHGEEFLEHGSALHGYTLYEEQLRVPCFVHDPRRGARRIDAATRTIDLLPTLVELLGVRYEGTHQGRSLVPLIRGDAETPPLPLFAQASLRAVKTVRLQSMTWDGWKLIETTVPGPRSELYRVETDPYELHDLARGDPGRVLEMRARMLAFVESLPVGRGGVVELDKEEKQRLRALGYLE